MGQTETYLGQTTQNLELHRIRMTKRACNQVEFGESACTVGLPQKHILGGGGDVGKRKGNKRQQELISERESHCCRDEVTRMKLRTVSNELSCN